MGRSGQAARASGILLDFTQSSVARRYLVDGVWMPQEPLERETTDPALVALKTLSGLKSDDLIISANGLAVACIGSPKNRSRAPACAKDSTILC